jgi:cytochrome P450
VGWPLDESSGESSTTDELLHHLARHSELRQHLRKSPHQIRAAIEELLPVYPIVPPARTLTSDYTLDGVEMKAGDTVLLAASAASRDPAAFVNPDEVRLVRRASWITAFGLGPHRCPGSHLARQELQIVLQLMLEMMPPFAMPLDFEPEWKTAGNVWGIRSLPLRFLA